jgi:predicted dehydrogenase
MFSVGILGGGNISETHLKAAMQVDRVKVTAVCGQNPDKIRKLSRESGAAAYLDLDEFLSHKPLDIILIGSPSGIHSEQGVKAAQRGFHVLVEKPIDVSVERAERLISACEKSGVKLGVFFQDRVSEGPVRLKRLLSKGKLGRPLLATAHVKWYRPPEYYSGSRWRGTWELDGGGALMNQGIHTLDLLQYLMGNVQQVFSYAGTQLHSIETEDTLVACIKFQNQALATYEATTVSFPGQPRRLILTGTLGSAIIEHDQLISVELISGEKTSDTVEEDRTQSESTPVVSNVSGHRRLIQDFISAIEGGRGPVCDGVEGLKSLVLAESIYRSAKTGQPIDVL